MPPRRRGEGASSSGSRVPVRPNLLDAGANRPPRDSACRSSRCVRLGLVFAFSVVGAARVESQVQERRRPDRTEGTGPMSGERGSVGRPFFGVPTTVWAVSMLWATFIFLLTVIRLNAFYSNAFDLGFFTQAISRITLGDLRAGTSIAGFGLFDSYLSPISLLLVPVARIGPIALLAVQAGAMAAGMVMVWRIAARRFSSVRSRWLVLAAFASSPVLLYAMWFDFHLNVIALPFLLVLVEGILRSDRRLMVIGSVGASLVREDLAFLVAAIAILSLFRKRRDLAWVVTPSLLVLVLAQFINGGSWFRANAYGYLRTDASLIGLLGDAATVVWYGGTLLVLIAGWVLPWLAWEGIRLRRLWIGVVASLPFLLSVLPTNHQLGFHYYFFFAVLGVWAVAEAEITTPTLTQEVLAGATIVLGLALGPLGLSLLDPTVRPAPAVVSDFVAHATEYERIRGLMTCIPRALPVSVASPLVPLVSDLEEVYLWPVPFGDVQFFPGLEPIVSRTEGSAPKLVIVGAPGWKRAGLFPEELGQLPGSGYASLEEDFEEIEVWYDRKRSTANWLGCIRTVGGN